MYYLLVISSFLSCISLSGSLLLQCSPSSICPGSVVSCECSGANVALRWLVFLDGQQVWRRIVYDDSNDDRTGPDSRIQGITCTQSTCMGVDFITDPSIVGGSELLSVEGGSSGNIVLSSLLNITFSSDISVRCTSADGTNQNAMLNVTSPPLLQNLSYTLTSIAHGRVELRLEWDLSLNNEGADTNHQIFVNASDALRTSSTGATVVINSTGQHLVEIRAINCAGNNSQTLVINTTGTCELPTSLPFGVRFLPMNGDELSFECGEGLLPQGRVVADCLPDGTWRPSPQNHVCITDCGVPFPPVNGRIENYESTAEGANFTFQCNKGFSPCGEITSVCTRNGWQPLPQSTNCSTNTTVDSIAVQLLSTAAVSGIVVSAVVGGVILYTCGIFTGMLLAWWRRRRCRKSGALPSGDDSVPVAGVVYEEVRPANSISMQENVSYGPLSQ